MKAYLHHISGDNLNSEEIAVFRGCFCVVAKNIYDEDKTPHNYLRMIAAELFWNGKMITSNQPEQVRSFCGFSLP